MDFKTIDVDIFGNMTQRAYWQACKSTQDNEKNACQSCPNKNVTHEINTRGKVCIIGKQQKQVKEILDEKSDELIWSEALAIMQQAIAIKGEDEPAWCPES